MMGADHGVTGCRGVPLLPISRASNLLGGRRCQLVGSRPWPVVGTLDERALFGVKAVVGLRNPQISMRVREARVVERQVLCRDQDRFDVASSYYYVCRIIEAGAD